MFKDITDAPCSTEKRPQGRNPAVSSQKGHFSTFHKHLSSIIVSFQSLLQLKPFNHALQIFSHT